jgi:outer membrane protein insertion porin family
MTTRFLKLTSTIKVAGLIVMSLILPISSLGDEAEKPKPVVEEAEGKFKWMIFPAIFYSSDFGIGGAALFAAGDPEAKYFTFGGSYSGKERQVLEPRYSQQKVFSAKDRLEIEPRFLNEETEFFNPIDNTQHAAIGTYRGKTTSVKLTWRHKIFHHREYGLRYVFSNFNCSDVLPIENASLSDKEMVDNLRGEIVGSRESSVSPFIRNDTRDNEINPSKGRYYDFYLTLARKEIGSKENFAKFGLDLRHYFNPGSGRHVLAFRVRTGSSTGDVPYHVKYNLGGEESMRGYPWGRFIGTRELLFNAEYRLTLFKELPFFVPNKRWNYGIALFVDGGRTWDKGDDLFSVDDFNLSYGIGQRLYFPPVIVFRIDFGIAARGESTGFYFVASQLF